MVDLIVWYRCAQEDEARRRKAEEEAQVYELRLRELQEQQAARLAEEQRCEPPWLTRHCPLLLCPPAQGGLPMPLAAPVPPGAGPRPP